MYQEHNKIKPVIVGELSYTDQFGNVQTPKRIYFAVGATDDNPGDAYTRTFSDIYGTALMPVFKANGERLRIPGYSGLCCHYNAQKGTLEDFYEE